MTTKEIRDKLEDVYIKETGRFAFLDANKLDNRYIEWLENQVMNNVVLDLVMLSEIEAESDKIANIIDNGISGHSLGESQGFVSGVEFVLNEIKERTHSA
jgi:hypothetical protein